MLRFVADEDFNGRILRGLLLQNHDMDVVRVVGRSEPTEWQDQVLYVPLR